MSGPTFELHVLVDGEWQLVPGATIGTELAPPDADLDITPWRVARMALSCTVPASLSPTFAKRIRQVVTADEFRAATRARREGRPTFTTTIGPRPAWQSPYGPQQKGHRR